jgi:hypothetical protein
MTDCIHRWVLASPNGPTSKGICKDCKTTRIFPNSTEQAIAWVTTAKRKIQREKLEKLNKKGANGKFI